MKNHCVVGREKRASSGLSLSQRLAAVALNFIASQFYLRVDATENNVYTLSPASHQVVRDLTEPVHVTAVISPDLPPPLHNLSQTVADTLDEYVAASDGALTYDIVSDTSDEQAARFDCPKVSIGEHSENEISVRAVYKCIAFAQGDEAEVIEDVQRGGLGALPDLEYQFTKALLNLQREAPRKLAFVSGYPVCQHPTQQHPFVFICNIQGANGVKGCLIPTKWSPIRVLRSVPAVSLA